MQNPLQVATNLGDGNTVELTTSAVAEEARLLLTNNDSTNAAKVSIYRATRES